MNRRPAVIPLIPHARALRDDYDAWICDIWGVLHNGIKAHAAPVAAVRAFRQAGGLVVLVTNAPRPHASVEEQLAKLAIGRDAYDGVLTSGDVTRQLLSELGTVPVHHIGPDRDLPVFDGLALSRTAPEQASTLVCTGLFDDTRETPDDYHDRFSNYVQRGMRMICANPDLTVDRGGIIIPCAGALAALYEKLGGKVTYAGKPHRPIYQSALAILDAIADRKLDRSRVLGVGDGIHTDIKGACSAGIDALYVASAIHLDGPVTADSVQRVFDAVPFRPVAAQTELTW
jgi:HAD superfamily hydrolase (TIGR01459 family)